MIIVSQDKRHSWNYENLEEIYVPEEVMEEWCIKVTTLRGDTYVIGYYKTEERAKEILQKIIQKYESTQSKLGNTYISLEKYDFVYEMPEE